MKKQPREQPSTALYKRSLFIKPEKGTGPRAEPEEPTLIGYCTQSPQEVLTRVQNEYMVKQYLGTSLPLIHPEDVEKGTELHRVLRLGEESTSFGGYLYSPTEGLIIQEANKGNIPKGISITGSIEELLHPEITISLPRFRYDFNEGEIPREQLQELHRQALRRNAALTFRYEGPKERPVLREGEAVTGKELEELYRTGEEKPEEEGLEWSVDMKHFLTSWSKSGARGESMGYTKREEELLTIAQTTFPEENIKTLEELDTRILYPRSTTQRQEATA